MPRRAGASRGCSPARITERSLRGAPRLPRVDYDRLVVAAERHAELAQQRERLVVARRRGDEGDVHPVDLIDHVVVDLREDHLLLDAERVVAAPVERAGVEAAEVADPRDRDAHEAVEELPHARTAQRHRRPDLLPLAEPEVRDRLLRLAPHRPLPGDRLELLDHRVEHLRLLDRLADAAVDHDLLERRHLVRVRERELPHEPVAHRALVVELEARRRRGLPRVRVRSALGTLTALAPLAALPAAPLPLLRVGARAAASLAALLPL